MTRNNHAKRAVFFSIFCATLWVLPGILLSCKADDETTTPSSDVVFSSAASLSKIAFTAAETKKTITIKDLKNQSVYLVKLNNSQDVAASNATGSASSSIVESERSGRTVSDSRDLANDAWGENVSGIFRTPKGTITRLENKNAQEAMAHPPASYRSVYASRNADVLPATLVVGTSTRTFSVAVNANESSYISITATLRGSSVHAQVWVAEDNDAVVHPTDADMIPSVTAQSIADTFTKIYPVETAIFGYEYGGDPKTQVPAGGMDGEIPINILIYDIGYDTATVSTSGSGVVGFFYSKDTYPIGTDNSNASEIFYIDSWFTAKYPGVMYSTLVHEFQHMIGYNEKVIQNGNGLSSWYTEMLSQVAEDMMSAYLETWLGDQYNVVADGPVNYRIYSLDDLAGYAVSGVTDWFDYSDNPDKNQSSYASTFAFGAYLVRNYGGASLVKAIASNNSVNESSITAALTSLGQSEKTFQEVFARYGEALMFSTSGFADGKVPSTLNTFDRTVSSTVNDHVYSFSAFDLWKLPFVYSDGSSGYKSPKIYSTSIIDTLRPYGAYLQTAASWQNVTGNLTVTVNKPSNPNVSLSLMVRTAN